MKDVTIFKVSGYGEEPKFLKKLKIYLIMNTISGPDQTTPKKKTETDYKNTGLDQKMTYPKLMDKLPEMYTTSNDLISHLLKYLIVI